MSRTADEFEPKSGETVRLGGALYRLDTNELHCADGQRLDLRGQSAEVLAYLARHAGQVVTKADLTTEVWGDTFVTDDSLVQCVGDIRRALGDSDHQIVETLVKRGYRLNHTPVKGGIPVVEEIPRVAVLAFEDHSTGANKGLMSDAIADGVIAGLAHFGEFSVVSRVSSFRFRNGKLGAQEIGEELGAQYVIGGSQQVQGGKLRVSAQLIEAKSETNIWSDTNTHDNPEDLDIQSEIIRNMATSLGFQICIHAPTLIKPRQRGALYYFLASRTDTHQASTDALMSAEDLNRKAIETDPQSPYGYIGLSYISTSRYLHRWVEKDPDAELRRAADFADVALELSPRNSLAHFARGWAHKEGGEMAQAERRLERSLALNPHATNVRLVLAFLALYRGQTQEAVDKIGQALRSNPGHPEWFFGLHAAALRQNQEYEAALAAFRNMASIPGSNHMQLGAIFVGLGRQEEAEEAMNIFRKRSPHHTVSRERAIEGRKFAKTDGLDRWLGLIRQAGLPE